MKSLSSVRFAVDIIGLIFRINDLLAAIQSIVAGEHIAECNCEQKVRHTIITKQLKADEQGGDRAVCHTTEHSRHSDSRTQCRGDAKQISKQASKSSTGKEGRYDLTAFKSGTKC